MKGYTYKWMEQSKESSSRSTQKWPPDFLQWSKANSVEKVFSTNGVGTKLYPYAKKEREPWSKPHSSFKNKQKNLTVNLILVCKMSNC